MQLDRNLELAGYILDGKVFYNYKTKMLIDLTGSGKSFYIRKTMSRVFEYLLEYASDYLVTDTELMNHVWDQYGLSSSAQRVWQVMFNIKSRLSELGIDDGFVMRVSKKGYLIKKSCVEILYCNNEF